MKPEPPGPRTGSTMGFVAFIVSIDMVGLGLILPVVPTLLESLVGESADRTAGIGGWLLFARALMQFMFAPVIGGLSDRFGRRPGLLLTLTLLGIDYLIMVWTPDLWWLFVGLLMSGVMGASRAAANSCAADIAESEERGRLFGMLGGVGASGFVIGPAIGGGTSRSRAPILSAASCRWPRFRSCSASSRLCS